jgi:hypothetical protein
MELDEFHVGERDARPMRDRVAVSRRDHRVRRVPVHLTATARGEHRRIGDDVGGAPFHARAHADARAAPHDQLEHAGLLEHADLLRAAHARDERPRDLGPGLVAVRVDDAVLRVRRFSSKREASARIEVEVRAGGLQLTHARRAFFDQHLDGGGIAQRRARGERVLPVQSRRVAGAERRGDPALRVGCRAVEERLLRHQHDVPALGCTPRRVQPGDAAADDEKAGADSIGHEA